MYICVCNAIRECELRQAARTIMGNAESVYSALGKQPQCRQCLDEAEEVVFAAREQALSRAIAAA